MEGVSRVYRENKETVILLLIPVAVLAKMIEHLLLPFKYFYDSTRMLNQSLEGMKEGAWGGNYEFTAQLFAKLNIFGFTTLLEWSLLIGVIFNIVLIIAFVKIKGIDFLQCMFALMCVGLCNIYVFNLGKDIIQFSLFSMCFIIIVIERFPSWLKVLGCAAVFYWESTFFRNYYIIMAAFTIGVYIMVKILRVKKVKLNIKKIIFIVLTLYLMMYLFLNIARATMPEEYSDILTSKKGTDVMTASTMIYDEIDYGTNVNLYMLNYIINSIRMLFPIELLTGGVFYVPFLAFQGLLLYYIYVNIKNIHCISNNNVIALSVFIAFFMGSVLFEPDFGSFARHEAAAFPVIILFALDNVAILKNGDIEDGKSEKVVVYE